MLLILGISARAKKCGGNKYFDLELHDGECGPVMVRRWRRSYGTRRGAGGDALSWCLVLR
jgi:hypothetical protein